MDRRRFSALLLGAPLAAAPGSSVRIGGGAIDVDFREDLALSREDLLGWVRLACDAVTAYFEKYPVPRARVEIVPGRRGRISNGRSFGEGGPHCRIAIGPRTTAAALREDWMLTHEMVHFGFPSVEEEHHWIEEGSATYIEPIARAKARQLTPERVWGDMVRDMHQGLPESGDEGLDRTHTWGRTYWGGALFCLLADIEIRKRTRNAKGLEHAIRAINRAGGTIDQEWPLKRALETGDKTVGGHVLMEMHERMSSQPAPLDLAHLWSELGVRREAERVVFDPAAPLAATRAAICG